LDFLAASGLAGEVTSVNMMRVGTFLFRSYVLAVVTGIVLYEIVDENTVERYLMGIRISVSL
jgi:hypothetical protein